MSVKALVNPSILVWARETANMSLDEACKAPNVSVEKLREWEAGESLPTLNQAKKLAKKYQRAFSLFYLDEIPEDFTPIKDFRRNGGDYSTGLIYFIREVETKVNWFRDLLVSDNEGRNSFVGSFNINQGVQAVADSITEAIKINERFASEKSPYRFAIERCEDIGISVLRSGAYHNRLPLDPEEVRGFTIADDYAPFVFINSRDSDEANLFTLIHELAHIWIKETGVSNLIDVDFRSPIPESGIERVEIFCNKVAANVLMPENLVRESFSNMNMGSREYEALRKKYGVSKIALAYRLSNLGLVSTSQFRSWKEGYDLAVVNSNNSVKKNSGGDYYRNMLVRNGRMFSSVVMGMYNVGSLSGSMASGLLSIKVNNLKTYQTYFK